MSQNPQPKYHHHVPQLLIRNWRGNSEKVWSWNKHQQRAAEKLPKEILGENFANRFIEFDGTKNNKVEIDFSFAEDEFATSVKQLLNNVEKGQVPRYNPKLTGGLHRLFWNVIARSTWMRSRHPIDETFYSDNIASGIIGDGALGNVYDFPVETLLQEGKAKENLKNQLAVQAIGKAAINTPSRVYDFGIAIFLTRNLKKTFLLGLNPIAQISTTMGPQPISALPISPKIAIAPFGLSNTFEVFNIDDLQLRAFNKKVWNASDEIVANNRELLISLSKDR